MILKEKMNRSPYNRKMKWLIFKVNCSANTTTVGSVDFEKIKNNAELTG